MLTCTQCGQENPEVARFCLACGAGLGEADAGEEERRIVSVLFVDLAGFTARAERLDPEDVRAVLTPYYERVRQEIESFGGMVEKFVGDAVMGVFGAPITHGDDPERAVRAALAIREALEAMNESDPELDLQGRLAVNTGEAIVALGARPSHGEAMVAGDVVNTAARLQTAAPVGGVLVGEETYVCTRSTIEYEPAAPVEAKGKQQPVVAWLAVAARAPAGERSFADLPIVGRRRELAALGEIWERVCEQRRPHLVTVFGPGGIGKSRLAHEFGRLVERSGARTIKGRSLAYGESGPYGAFAQQVKQVAGIFDNDELSSANEKLAAAVAELAGSEGTDETASHLAMLVGLEREGSVSDRETLFFSARVLVESLATRQPTVLIFEDIHWADASLLDLMEELAARVRDVPLLMLALSRPELRESRPAWGGGLPAYAALPLEQLDESEADELAVQLLQQHGLAEARERATAVAATAEGNPLFIEELMATLAERATDQNELPTSIRGIVGARLDVLPAEERAVLLDAAVVGKVFWRGALVRLRPDRKGLTEVLGSLEHRDLVRREVVSRIRGEQQFIFKHGLIRDVAYKTLPRAVRRESHAEVARFLEEATSETAVAAEVLAHHWREAGDAERALNCMLAAAEQAGRSWAKERAVALYSEALQLVPDEDAERRRSIKLRQAVAIHASFQLPDAERLRRRGDGA